jgi:hypothetical protein
VRVALGVVADEDDVNSVERGGGEGENVAAIQARQPFDRDGEEVQPDHSAERAGVCPAREMLSPENRQKQRNEDDAGAGDKAGFRGRGVEEAGGLECVAAEHEDAEGGACEDLFPFQTTKSSGAEHRHQDYREREAQCQKEEDAGVGERVFHDDESGAPKEGAEDQGEVGFDGCGLGVWGGRVDGGIDARGRASE